MFDFSRGDFDGAIARFKAVLAADPAQFRRATRPRHGLLPQGRFCRPRLPKATRPRSFARKEQLVHTNLSLFYMKSRRQAEGRTSRLAGENRIVARGCARPEPAGDARPAMSLNCKWPTPNRRRPVKFPSQPWKKKKADADPPNAQTPNARPQNMKTAYELAMERLGKTAPTVKLTAGQKKQLAELDSQYAAKIAEREIALKDEINQSCCRRRF